MKYKDKLKNWYKARKHDLLIGAAVGAAVTGAVLNARAQKNYLDADAITDAVIDDIVDGGLVLKNRADNTLWKLTAEQV